jgi:ABC-type hemin transport system substrate-binding protein
MDQEPHIPPTGHQRSPTYHYFWPVLLLGLSLLLVFTWEIWVGVATRSTAQQLQEQQVRMVDQAKQAQSGLEKLVRELVDLSKTDDAAKKLVTKFGVKLNNLSAPAATPTP